MSAGEDVPAERLRRRTEGVVWMVWGLATGAIFLTIPAMELLVAWPWFLVAPLVVWSAAGGLLVWRVLELAGVEHPEAGDAVEESPAAAWLTTVVLATVAVLLLFGLGLVGAAGGGPVLGGAAPITLVIGVLWLTLGLLRHHRVTAAGRLLQVGVGATILVASVLYGILFTFDAPGPQPADYVFAPVVVGLMPFVVGLWHAARAG